MKRTDFERSLSFSAKSVCDGRNLLTQMKSLCDEIAYGGEKDGFNFIKAARL